MVLAIVLVRTAVVPTGTLPKSTTAEVATSPLPDWATGVLASRAPQPSMVIRRKRTVTKLPRVPNSFTEGL